jgi:hypothetical protein
VSVDPTTLRPPLHAPGEQGGASGVEVDRQDFSNSPPGLEILAEGTNPDTSAQMTYYDHHPGGGFLFSVGSISFGGSLVQDTNLQIIVRNALDELVKFPPTLKQLFSGGEGVIYALMDNGDLLWYRHDGRGDGSFKWADNNARKVGEGWNFKQAFSGGDGVICAIADNGDLLWYRHDGWGDGSFRWADNNARKVGEGWKTKRVFSI